MATNVSYGGNSLQTTNILTDTISHESLPKAVSDIFKLQNWDKFVVPYADQFEPKTISLAGTILSDTIANLDTALDTFRSYFTGTNKNLDIDYAGGTRRYVIAKVDNPVITRPNGLTWATWSVDFISASHGRTTSSNTLLTANARTSQAYTDSITVLGTAPYQQPVITYTLSSGTGLTTGKTVKIGNDNNGQAITVTRDWVAGDVLVIDVANQTVQVNSTNVAFTGGLPEFIPGSGSVSYYDDFTTRSFNITITQNALYL